MTIITIHIEDDGSMSWAVAGKISPAILIGTLEIVKAEVVSESNASKREEAGSQP